MAERAGTPGRIVCTDLIARVMPILRYETGVDGSVQPLERWDDVGPFPVFLQGLTLAQREDEQLTLA